MKRAIATNSNTSVETLKKLSHDSDKSVRQLAYSGLKQKGEKPIDKPFKPAKPVEDDNPGKYMSADFDPMEYFGLNDWFNPPILNPSPIGISVGGGIFPFSEG